MTNELDQLYDELSEAREYRRDVFDSCTPEEWSAVQESIVELYRKIRKASGWMY